MKRFQLIFTLLTLSLPQYASAMGPVEPSPEDILKEAEGLNKNTEHLKLEYGSFEAALEKNEGDSEKAYEARSAEIYKQYKKQCLDHRSCKKNPQHEKCKEDPNIEVQPEQMGFPARTDENGFASLPEDREMKTCEQWANYQLENDDELKEARKYMTEQQKEQDSQVEDPGDRAISSDAMKSHIVKQIEKSESESLLKSCRKFYSEKLDRMIEHGGAYYGLTNEDDEDYERAFSQAGNRKMPDPFKCKESEDFDFKGLSLFTNFNKNVFNNTKKSGTKKICAGMAYQPVSINEHITNCNAFLYKAKSVCNDPNHLDPEGKKVTPFIFDNVTLDFSNLVFQNADTCTELFKNKFKQCIGMAYTPVSYVSKAVQQSLTSNNNADSINISSVSVLEEANMDRHLEEVENSKPSVPLTCTEEEPCSKFDQQQRANEKGKVVALGLISEEINNKWGVCLAFRELSKQQIDKVGEWTGREDIQSFDGRYRCRRTTPWTQDFKACKALIQTYNGFLAGDQVRQVSSQGWSTFKQSQIQQDNLGSVAQGEDQVNAGLNAQKETYKHFQNKENVNLGFFSMQAGTLSTMLAVFPTPNSFSRKCGTEDDSLDAHCIASPTISLVDADGEKSMLWSLFPNQHTKNEMWGKVMESSAQAALAAFKASAYKKRLGALNKFQSAYNDVNKDNVKQTDSDLQVGYCSLNPTAPRCQQTGPRVAGNSRFSNNNFAMQGNNAGEYSFDQDSSLGEFDEDNDNNTNKEKNIEKLDKIMNQNNADSFNKDFKKVGAGSFSRAHKGGGGGGGGGAGGASGGAYKGGGSGGSGSNGYNSAFGGVNKKVSYKAGGSFKSGKGSGPGAKKKSSNPFSNLFGSKKSRSVASEVNDIAPRHSGLFDKISKRYGRLQQDNRLLKLESN